ncbi:MAG: translocation/assembly module TamB [Treponema sp.]|nr:translocation/assembly module TamB [Treponema sp.]
MLLVRPAYDRLGREVSDYARNLKQSVEEQFSMKLSYKSLSPSILSSVNFREVTVTNLEGEKVASISRIRLDYKLLKLLKGDFTNCFKSLVVDSADVSGSALADLIARNAKGTPKESKKENQTSLKDFDYSSIFPDFPLNVLLKNISISYSRDKFYVSGNIRKMNLDYSNKQKLLLCSSDIFANGHYGNENFSGNVLLDGKLFQGFENSTCNISINNLADSNFRVGRLNFFASYNQGIISLETIKSAFPLNIDASFDLTDGIVRGEVKAKDLTASQIIQAQKKNDLFKKISDLKLNTDSSISYNVNSQVLEYTSDSGVSLPSVLVPGGADISIDLKGNGSKVKINSLSMKGSNYDVYGDLEYVFKTMSLLGTVEVPQVVLPNGSVISSEVFFDSLQKGFIAYIPQLFIDDNTFTALELTAIPQKDSFDFSFEGYDYSHFEADTPGRILVEGSYLLEENYLQTSVAANSFFLDSALKTSVSFMPDNAKASMRKTAESLDDFVFSTDGYFSTDFHSVSFNVPYILLASVSRDNQALLLSFDGNEQSVSLSQADLVLGKKSYHASGSVDFLSDTKEMFMLLDLNAEDIPYHFAGNLTNNVFTLIGDYNSSLRLDFSKKNIFEGHVITENIPLSILDASVLATINTDFSYSEENGIEVAINRMEFEEAGNQFRIKPHVSLSGNVNRYGASLGSIVYSDLYSQLEGSADVFFALSENILGSAGIKLSLKSPMTDEALTVSADISNPDMLPLSLNSFMNDFYMDASTVINNLNMNRFTRLKSNNNVLSASLYVSGTPEHPYVSASLDNLSLLVSTEVMHITGSAVMENRDVIVNDFKFNFGSMEINRVSGNFSLETFEGAINASLNAKLMEDSLFVPFKLETSDVVKQGNALIPSAFTVSLSTEEIYGSFIKNPTSFALTAYYTEDGLNIISSDNLGLFASYLSSGDVFAVMNCENYGKMKLEGIYEQKTGIISGKLSDVDFNLKNLGSFINLEQIINIYNGQLSGALDISGTIDNPLFAGTLVLDRPEFNVPYCLPDKVATARVPVIFENGEINIPETRFTVKKNGELFASCRFIFDKWRFDRMESVLRTEEKKYVPIDLEMLKGMSVAGDANLTLNLVLENGDFELTGDIFAEKTELYVDLPKLVSTVNMEVEEPAVNFRCSLNIRMGTHVRVNVDPLLRAIFVPGGTLGIVFDSDSNQLSMFGILHLKSGDVSYLNRNFYVKEGSLKFSPNDLDFNPIINVRAETRERDEDGENVVISLNAQNQFIRDFNPKFSSVPAKSDLEIQRLLGQIAVADSESVGNFLFAAGDYALQSLIGRKFENKLRDFLNFDIFSLRTNIIQNTLNFSLSNRTQNETLKAGNFFDNSTVYIGKYLGSALYVDAMLNLQYDDKRIRDAASVGGMIFKPEFGMELESPFGNIRWNVAPDIDALMNKQYVPSSSVSLSWKFSL